MHSRTSFNPSLVICCQGCDKVVTTLSHNCYKVATTISNGLTGDGLKEVDYNIYGLIII